MRTLGLAGLALSVLAQPLSAEIIEQDGQHFVSRNSAEVAATPDAIWLLLIDPKEWWSDSHTWSGDADNLSLTPQGGGCFCETLMGKDPETGAALSGSAQHMSVLLAQPGKALRMRGALGPLQSEPADGVLTISLEPAGDRTRITFEYVVAGKVRYPMEQIAKAVDGVMKEQLDGLVAAAG